MRVFSIENDNIFKSYLNFKMKLIYDLGVSTGLRISDIVALKKDILKVKEPTIKEQKTGKSKRFYIKKDIKSRLLKIAEHSKNEYIFYSNSKLGHVTRQAVWKAFKKAYEKTGEKVNIGTQSMRKKYARKLKEKHSFNYIKNKLNHESIMTSILYCANEKEIGKNE